MTIGPVMLDVDGLTLSEEEKDMLKHPLVGGVIFFARNYESVEQIRELVKSIHENTSNLVITCVDQEGGRVQRFKNEFTRLPPLRPLGKFYDENEEAGMAMAKAMGWLMAVEVLSVGVDFSFAPVLDLDYGVSDVIGDRAFHSDAKKVSQLARAYIQGMEAAGMASVGKHFPGHGAVVADSHLELPVDNRSVSTIIENDIVPFEDLIKLNYLYGIMPAHVVYEEQDSNPAGFSKIWLQQILRQKLGFQGAIFSDDLNMAAAGVAGSFTERAELALKAGCDMVLVCNNRQGALEVLDNLQWEIPEISVQRLTAMQAHSTELASNELKTEKWQIAVNAAKQLLES